MGRPLYLLEQAFSAMGSPCEVKLYADSKTRARHLAKRVIEEVERLEAKYSRYREDSLLSDINRVAQAGGSMRVDPETAGLLDYVATCWQQSQGLFDVTSGVLRKAWQFKEETLPEPDAIQRLLDHVGWDRLSWQNPAISFPEAGLELDLQHGFLGAGVPLVNEVDRVVRRVDADEADAHLHAVRAGLALDEVEHA